MNYYKEQSNHLVRCEFLGHVFGLSMVYFHSIWSFHSLFSQYLVCPWFIFTVFGLFLVYFHSVWSFHGLFSQYSNGLFMVFYTRRILIQSLKTVDTRWISLIQCDVMRNAEIQGWCLVIQTDLCSVQYKSLQSSYNMF